MATKGSQVEDPPIQGGPEGTVLDPDPSKAKGAVSGNGAPGQRQPLVVIGGKEFYSQEEVEEEYGKMQSEMTEKDRLIGRQGQELGDLRKGARQEPLETIVEKPDLSTRLLTEPEKVLEERDNKIKGDLKVEYAWAKTWDEFYDLHPELDGTLRKGAGPGPIVQDAYSEVYPDVKDLPIKKALEKVAERAQGKILGLKTHSGETETTVLPSGHASTITGGTQTNKKPAPQAEPERDRSLSGMMREKRAKQRGATA